MNINEIEQAIRTVQQEKALEVYKEDFNLGSESMDFQIWYGMYCYEKGLFNDINQSAFEPEERPGWA